MDRREFVSAALAAPRAAVLPYQPGCRWRVEGLPVGRYDASLNGSDGSHGRASFSVANQEVSRVLLEAPSAHLAGRILYGGVALARADVVLAEVQRPRNYLVKTDAEGRFSVWADSAGLYTLGARIGGQQVPQVHVLQLNVGENGYEWRITGGELSVRLEDADLRTPTNVVFQSPSINLSTPLPKGLTAFDRGALPPGQYHIFAIQEGSLQSGVPARVSREIATVTINEGHPTAVSLLMVENSAELSVQAPEGEPILGAILSHPLFAQPLQRAESGPAQLQRRPGVYPLSHYPPGAAVEIGLPKPYGPACRLAPLDQTVVLRASLGRRMEIRLTRPGIKEISLALGTLSGMRESDCPVPLASFDATTIAAPEGQSAFLIRNFPLDSTLIWELRTPRTFRQSLTISNADPLLLQLP